MKAYQRYKKRSINKVKEHLPLPETLLFRFFWWSQWAATPPNMVLAPTTTPLSKVLVEYEPSGVGSAAMRHARGLARREIHVCHVTLRRFLALGVNWPRAVDLDGSCLPV